MAKSRVTWMHSGQLGAPQMNGAKNSEGQMLQVLDACLIDGFNLQSVLSAANNIEGCILSFSAAHGYERGQLVQITGATDSSLNGKFRVVNTETDSITVDAVGVTDFTGSIITKVAALGFESIFGSATALQRAYRSPDLNSTRTVLHLDMSLPVGHGYNVANPVKRAMVDMCEDMVELGVQINSYTDAFNRRPTNRNGKMLWYQARDYNKTTPVTHTVNSNWIVIGNNNHFYLLNDWFKSENYASSMLLRDWYFFGDSPSLVGPTDKFNCAWVGSTFTNDVGNAYFGTSTGTFNDTSLVVGYYIKSHLGTGTLLPFKTYTSNLENIMYSGVSDTNPANFRNLGSNPFGVGVLASTTVGWRGTLPNLYAVPYKSTNNLGPLNFKQSDGSILVAVQSYADYPIATPGYILFNTGD